MPERQDSGLPESIDPKKLVVQEGEDRGRIADVELAQVGAEAEGDALNKTYELSFGLAGKKQPFVYKNLSDTVGPSGKSPDELGEDAMGREVSSRAKNMVPKADEELRTELGNMASNRFRDELRKKSDELAHQDDSKAKELIEKLSETE